MERIKSEVRLSEAKNCSQNCADPSLSVSGSQLNNIGSLKPDGSDYSFGFGKDRYDFQCVKSGSSITCSGYLHREDRYEDPLDLHQQYGIGKSPSDPAPNLFIGKPFSLRYGCPIRFTLPSDC